MSGRERHRGRSSTACTPFRASVALALTLTLAAEDARAADPDPWFGEDKAKHFAVTTGISAGTYAVGASLLPARWHALALGAGVTLAIGAAKEGWDALGHGDPSWRDFTWDVIGTACGLGLAWSVDLLIRGVDDAHPLFRAPAPVVTF